MSNPKEEEKEVVHAEAKGGNLLLSAGRNGNNSSSRLIPQSTPGAYEQLNAIRKLTVSNHYCKTSSANNELNNNSITQQEFHSSLLISPNSNTNIINKMEDQPNRKSSSNSNSKPLSPSAITTANTLSSSIQSESRESKSPEYPQILTTSKDIPTYSSIFATQPNSPSSPPQSANVSIRRNQMTPGRPPLVKQDETDIPVAKAISGLAASNKELAAFKYDNGRNNKSDSQRTSEEDECEEDDIDERLPFNSRINRSSRNSTTNKHNLPEAHKQCRSQAHLLNSKQHSCSSANDHDIIHHHHHCNMSRSHNTNKQNHTKISFNDSRPPSFANCHTKSGCNDLEASLDRRSSRQGDVSCNKCDCNDCFRSRKLNLFDGHQHHSSIDSNITQPFKYDRTKTLHLVLKSIVLVLLTILLLIFLIAILVASHYLPQALERIMNATRSFNVTIAG